MYGAYGNPVIYKGETLEWQYGKRLKKYGETTLTYSGYDRRNKKGEIVYIYDNDGRIINQLNISSSLILEYFYDINGIIGLKYDGKNYLYQKDVQGNIIAILDTRGRVVVKYIYDAWGNHIVLDKNGEVITDVTHIGNVNPYRYRGYFYDTETKLYYLQTRYYDPETGRFISPDDVSYLDPEHINGLNLYAYCGNNPVMNIDPNGTFFKKIANWFKNTVSAVGNWVVNEVKSTIDTIDNIIFNLSTSSKNINHSTVSMDGDFGFGFDIGIGSQSIFDKFSAGFNKFFDDIGKAIYHTSFFIWDDILKPLSDNVFVDGTLAIGGLGVLGLSKIPQFAAYSSQFSVIGGWITVLGAVLWFRSLFD